MNKAYCIVNILSIEDQNAFAKYVEGHIPSIKKFGGKFLVKGSLGKILEGNWPSNVIVIHEFPNIQKFEQWYNSSDYQPWKELRQSCAKVNVIVTEGE